MIFTFGFGHVCGCGRSLRNCYTELPSREDMVRLWGIKWSHEYETAEQAGVERWQLSRIATDEGNPQCRCGGAGREPWGAKIDDERIARLTMSDDRIVRLTELARRVWPERGPYLNDVVVDHLNASIWSRDAAGVDVERISIYCAQNALDALEAALLVLAGVPTDADQHEALLGRYKALTQEVSKLWAMRERVEQLARNWTASGEALRDSGHAELADAYLDCAAELRQRAKEEA